MKKFILALVFIFVLAVFLLAACGDSGIVGTYVYDELNVNTNLVPTTELNARITAISNILSVKLSSLSVEFKNNGTAIFKVEGSDDETYSYNLAGGRISLTDGNGQPAEEEFFGEEGFVLKYISGKVIIAYDASEMFDAGGSIIIELSFKKIAA